MGYTKIMSIEHLKEFSKDTNLSAFIYLNGGLRSSKTIHWDPKEEVFIILNEIDDSEQILTEAELSTESNIAEAIDKGAFYKY